MSRLEIGSTAFVAVADPVQKWIPCPDCFGKKYLTVIMGDGTHVRVDCPECAIGYGLPSGQIESFDYTPTFHPIQITGFDSRLEGGKLKDTYWENSRGYNGEDVYTTKEEAVARSAELIRERVVEEAKRIANKYDNSRSWASNATYHRKSIREAQKQIAHHSAKLGICLEHSKSEPKQKKL